MRREVHLRYAIAVLAVAAVAWSPEVVFVESAAVPALPAVYVFGDSLADVGNNNYLPGPDAKANFPHYGVDYPHHTPTGRFSNGYNVIDFLSIHMGFRRSPPPYLSLNSSAHLLIRRGLRGVNFASAGSGILNSTGSRITFSEQVKNFEIHRAGIELRVGGAQTSLLLSKSVFLISSGGNDVFAFFYGTNASATAAQVAAFDDTMIATYSSHLRALYRMGARKFAILNVPPVGCCPIARILHPAGECIDGLNALVKGFNDKVPVLFSSLSQELKGFTYMVGNSYNILMNVFANPTVFGYKNVSSACCGSGRLRAEKMCAPETALCEKRGEFVFWDRIHPSQATAEIAGKQIYGGGSEFAAPINLKELVES